ncbi:MAG TPA: biotin carboxylase N-terminal domain-containing protein, partial [Geminicoccaceae bacterium]|nr:biotin carboxylase N-terminal domain-containing protein [Geminicoccaceae bacterium]
MADEAVRIGPPPAAESYLRIGTIVDAARETGAEAVHPGYGFLSENPRLADALEMAGIAFIGPPANAIALLGDKIESKSIARRAGVSTVPGHPHAIAEVKEALRVAERIGYPVMVKAAAGGGGKGMRVAADGAALREGFERARSEARSSFGDDRVLLEKFIPEPRHIEIQVLADAHGHAVYLGERECSIQRRHQKVIEEAPSPFLDAETRRAMGEQAVRLARAVDYRSAGTVEFIVDQERNFYFLEMNTRLQVEHPVTELVTGLDLVEQMIRVAAGLPLGFTQDDVRLDGWAIEARLYAEDPARGFLPSTGRIRAYREPAGEGIRVDSGLEAGGEVALFYDPMIAKVIAHGPDRDGAIDRLRGALDSFVVRGPTHNLPFLAAVLAHPRFRAGRLSTNFIAEEYGERFAGRELDLVERRVFAAVALALRLTEEARAGRISGQLPGWRYAMPERWHVRLGAEDVELRAEPAVDGGFRITPEGARGGGPLAVRLDWRPGEPVARAEVDGRRLVFQIDRRTEGYRLSHGGAGRAALVRTRRAAELAARIPAREAPDAGKLLLSPMPGLLVSVAVEPGQAVKAGQELAVLEAMKMENVLRAEHDGTVAEVRARPGTTVAADEVLVAFE